MTAITPLITLSQRRFELTARRPRELFVPLITPILFALVIAPALKVPLHTGSAYESFVAVGTIGLLIPLTTMFSGLSVIVDRESGAQRELLAAPVPRPFLVLGNLAVALAVTAFQVVALLGFALARGIDFHAGLAGLGWFLPAAVLFAVGMYGAAEHWRAGSRGRRSTSPACRRSRSSRGSSRARSSRSPPCRASSPGSPGSCRSRTA